LRILVALFCGFGVGYYRLGGRTSCRDGRSPNQAKVIGENTISLFSTRGRTAGVSGRCIGTRRGERHTARRLDDTRRVVFGGWFEGK
jgi:hypothetical protein